MPAALKRAGELSHPEWMSCAYANLPHSAHLGVGDLAAEHVVLLVVAPHEHHKPARACVLPEPPPATRRRYGRRRRPAARLRLLCCLAPLGGRLRRERRVRRRPQRAGLDELVLDLAQRRQIVGNLVDRKLRYLGLDLLEVLGLGPRRLEQRRDGVDGAAQLAGAPGGCEGATVASLGAANGTADPAAGGAQPPFAPADARAALASATQPAHPFPPSAHISL